MGVGDGRERVELAREWLARYEAMGAPHVGVYPRRVGRVVVRRAWACAVCRVVVVKGSRVLKCAVGHRDEGRVLCEACEGWTRGGV